MRISLPIVALAFVFCIVVACSSESDKPARTISCAGGQPPTAVGDAGNTCAGICLPAKDPCVETATPEACPGGYAFATNRSSCAGGASCCVPIAHDGGHTDASSDAKATDASSDASDASDAAASD